MLVSPIIQRVSVDRIENSIPVTVDRALDRGRLTDDVNAGASGLRVLMVASAGGHWIELSRLSDAFAGCDCQFVSTATGMVAPLGKREVLVVPDSSRDTVSTMIQTMRCLFPIVRAFDPELVVSTGAAPGAIALALAKLFGARTIWIDSIANSERLSLSGQMVRPVADMRLTQWSHLATASGSVRYFGQIL